MKHRRKTRKITRVRNKRRSKKTRFVQKGGDAVNSLNTLTSRIKLPWTKFRGEMHLPGHNFTGPGTNLDKRLNPDGTPKPWSKPVNRVDNAAYRHDLAYARHSDTPQRIVADKKMIKELEGITNPTVKERMERAVVKPILKTSLEFEYKRRCNVDYSSFRRRASC